MDYQTKYTLWMNARIQVPVDGYIQNPFSKRKIKVNGPTYKGYEKEYPVYKTKSPPLQRSISCPLTSTYSLVERIKLAKTCSDFIKTIDQWNLSGSSSHITDLSVIGRGSYGQVYVGKMGPRRIPIAVKEARMNSKKRVEPDEYKFLNLINTLLYQQLCPNFFFTYGLQFCDSCIITLVCGKVRKGPCYITFMELASGTLPEAIEPEIQENILFQLLAGLHALQKYYHIHHNDLKRENILVKNIPPDSRVWEYDIRNTKYYLPNIGMIVCISDFGVSRSCSPKYTTDGYLGERNASVLFDTFVPFTSKFFASRNKIGKVTLLKPVLFNWKERFGFTRNKFYKNVKIEPDIKVDFNDAEIFPPFEFFFDIQDIVRTFIGGKRLTQSESHIAIQSLDLSLKKKLTEICYAPKGLFKTYWEFENSVKFFLAGVLIEKLFETSFKTKKSIIESYII